MGKGNRKVLVGILIGLCSIVIILIVIIGVNLYQKNLQLSTDGTGQTSEDINVAEVSEEEATVLAKIAEYQVAIDAVRDTDPQSAAKIYQERVFYLMDNKNNQNYADYVLADVIAIDDIEQSTGSAISVINYADYFNNEDLSARYEEIFDSRKEMEGEVTNGRG